MRDHLAVTAAAVVAALAVVGFLIGTSESQYHTDTPAWHPYTQGTAKPYDQLRRDEPPSTDVARTCIDCHEEQGLVSASHQRMTHPVDVEIPRGADLEGLVAAGARIVDGKVGCRTCHTPHNASKDATLVVTTDESLLCESCHTDRRPAGAHPDVVDGCLQCHDPHESESRTLLRTHSSGLGACLECHDEQAVGMRSGAEGHSDSACSSCHGMHRPAAKGPECLECHDDLTFVHPEEEADCADCHETHSGMKYLAHGGSFDAGCLDCHDDHPDPGEHECADCHNAHDASPKGPSDANPASRTCLECHDDKPASHPTDLLLTASGLPHKGESPYFSSSGQRTKGVGEITCRSCHDPHSDQESLLIPGQSRWCSTCHGEEAETFHTDFHDPAIREGGG